MFTALEVPAIHKVAMMTNGSQERTRTPCSRMRPFGSGLVGSLEWQIQNHGRLAVPGQSPEIHPGDDSDTHLEQEFFPGEQRPSRAPGLTAGGRELQPVVRSTEDGQPEQNHQSDVDIVVEEVGQ